MKLSFKRSTNHSEKLFDRKVKDSIVKNLTASSVLLILFIIIAMLGVILTGGWSKLSYAFLSEFPREGMTRGGIFPAIAGTALMTLIMAVAAVPFGVVTAIYLAEYASEASIFAKIIRFAVRTLSVVPSIIFGLFGLGFFIGFIGKNADLVFNGGVLKWGQPNILWASLTMALLTLPVVIVSVEEAIRTIPVEMREASLALGATKWQTVKKVILRKSLPGIIAATVLSLSRAFGETMAVLMVCGNISQIPHSVFDACYPLPALIANNYGEMLSMPSYESALMFSAFLLFVIVFLFNGLSRFTLNQIEKRYQFS